MEINCLPCIIKNLVEYNMYFCSKMEESPCFAGFHINALVFKFLMLMKSEFIVSSLQLNDGDSVDLITTNAATLSY